MNPRYQQELFQQFERHLPGGWFRLLANKQGPLFPVVWALCGGMAGLQESLEAAQRESIPSTSSGFWLSLHLLGLGLRRRPEETDPQAYQRYQFEFLPTRNTREGLLTLIRAYSGLDADVSLETNFAEGRYGELLLRVDSDDPWQDFDWWWVNALFSQWVANGLNRRLNLRTAGLRILALPPFTHQHRFPTSEDLLAPFWERPAFLNELRLVQKKILRVRVATVAPFGWVAPDDLGPFADLPIASTWQTLPPSPFVERAGSVASVDISQNLLAFLPGASWNQDIWRLRELWEGLKATQQPGQPFVYWSDNADRPDIDESYSNLRVTFQSLGLLNMIGYGPWTLTLGTGGDDTSTTVETPVETLPLAGEWWTDDDRVRRRDRPFIEGVQVDLSLQFQLPNPDLWRISPPERFEALTCDLPEEEPTIGPMGWTMPANNEPWWLPPAETWLALHEVDPLAEQLGDPTIRLHVEFLLEKAARRRRYTEFELGLGYRYPSYGVQGGWDVPDPTDYQLASASLLSHPQQIEPWQVLDKLPVYQTVAYRRIDALIPPDINTGFAFHLSHAN